MSDVMGQLPRPIVERMGRMSGMAMRAIIALIDEEPDTFAALVERIGTWDDDPGRAPYPMARYEFPIKEVLRIVNDCFTAIEERGPLPNEAVAEGARGIVERLTPEEYRAQALARLTEFPRAGSRWTSPAARAAAPWTSSSQRQQARGCAAGPAGAWRRWRTSG